MANNNGDTVHNLLTGLESFLTTKTVVGEPISIGDTIIIPMADVSFGVGAGSFKNGAGKDNNSGGMGGKMSPSAVLVIKDGTAKMVNLKEQDKVGKLFEMVPELINKFTKGKNKGNEAETEAAAAETAETAAEE